MNNIERRKERMSNRIDSIISTIKDDFNENIDLLRDKMLDPATSDDIRSSLLVNTTYIQILIDTINKGLFTKVDPNLEKAINDIKCHNKQYADIKNQLISEYIHDINFNVSNQE